VTGVAALITAVAGAIAGLYQAGLFKSNTNQHPAFYSASPESLSRQGKPGDELSTAQWIFQVRSVWETDASMLSDTTRSRMFFILRAETIF